MIIIKKGFTLIELLAVIVILAIIALIATPIILDIIIDARESSAFASGRAYVKAVTYKMAQYQFDNVKIPDGTYYLNEIGDVCLYGVVGESDCKIVEGSSANSVSIEVDGPKPTRGFLVIKDQKVVSYSFLIQGIEVTETIPGYYETIDVIPSFQQAYVYFAGHYWKVLRNTYDSEAFSAELQERYGTSDFTIGEEHGLLLLYDDEIISNEPILSFSPNQYENSAVDQWLNTTFYDSLGSYKQYLTDVSMSTIYDPGCILAGSSYSNKVGLLGAHNLNQSAGFLNSVFSTSGYFDLSRMWIPATGSGNVIPYTIGSSSAGASDCYQEWDEEQQQNVEICVDSYNASFVDGMGMLEYAEDDISTSFAHLRPIILLDADKIEGVTLVGRKGYTEEEQYQIIEESINSTLEYYINANFSEEEIESMGGLDAVKLYLIDHAGYDVSSIEQMVSDTVASGIFGYKPVYTIVFR